jgi:hypothetical protein
MAIDTATLTKIKTAMRITTDAFDDEISDLVDAALADLRIAGVRGTNVALSDPLVLRAVITYCRLSFGEPDEYDRLKRSYDEQKAQMSMATGYTIWSTEA